MNRILVKEAYDAWQLLEKRLHAIPRWRQKMRSKAIQKLVRIEHKAHWRYLRRAGELEAQQKRRSHLVALTRHVDQYRVECDGATRIVHLALVRAGVAHECMEGYVLDRHGDAVVQPHYWVEAEDFLIDYRLRLWAGPEAPHGVFLDDEHRGFHYIGEPIELGLAGCMVVEAVCK